jgi:hypothetical protein
MALNSTPRAVNILESILRPGSATFARMYLEMKALLAQAQVQGSATLFDAQGAPDDVVGVSIDSVDPPVTNADVVDAFAMAGLFVAWCETPSQALGGKSPAQVAIKLLGANALGAR